MQIPNPFAQLRDFFRRSTPPQWGPNVTLLDPVPGGGVRHDRRGRAYRRTVEGPIVRVPQEDRI